MVKKPPENGRGKIDTRVFKMIKCHPAHLNMQTCVVLQPKSTMRNAQISGANDGKPSTTLAANILRRATAPELIGTWKWNTIVLHLYAYKSGKAGTENKHELPPPHDNVLLFGEAVIFATKDNVLVPFTSAEYTKFYNQALGGFEDLGSEDSDTDDEEGADDAEEEVEEEVEEDAAAEDDDEKSVEEIVDEEDEEAEAPVRPVPKIIKTKRTAKKMPTWYTIPELSSEPYKLVRNP